MKRILVVYHSQEFGNTRRMAELVAQGCREVPGIEVEMVNVNERRVDIDAVERADAYALGSPDYFSYMAGGLKQFFDDLHIADLAGRKVKGKPCVLFLTHGGGGKAIASLQHLAEAMALTEVAPSVSSQGAPTGDTVKHSIELGKALAEHISRLP